MAVSGVNIGSLTAALAPIPTGEGALPITVFLDAVAQIAEVYDMLFSVQMIANQLKGDINNSIDTVRKVHATAAYTADSTFEELVPHEISAKGLAKVRKDKTSATIGTLWMKRALSFICMFLKLLVESDAPSKDVAYQTYQTILKPYHGWLASKGVGMTMSMVPYRATIFTSLGFADAAEAKEKLSALVAAIEPALNDLNTMLAAQGADFPDKV